MMRDFLQRLLFYNCKLRRASLSSGSKGGFTLIELLVALVVASIMISTLLGFMVNILTTDRREQAKATTEQEMQSALDYIARDLEQAVYIYDAEGLQEITNGYSTTTATGQSQLETDSDEVYRVPVLVFWKRDVLRADQTINVTKKKGTTIGCLVKSDLKPCNDQDYPVYSLVAYYLMKDKTCGDKWSCAARIGRFEIRDGIQDADGTVQDGTRDSVDYDLFPSKGFKPFVLTGSLEASMNSWEKDDEAFDNNVEVLIDYIDQTTIAEMNNSDNPKHRKQEDCQGVFGFEDDDANNNPQMVPNYENYSQDGITLNKAARDMFKTGSFYACVDSNRTLARVFIRGNSVARIVRNDQIATQAKYRENASAFFPTASIQVQGRGLVNLEKN
ncbi:hormogonium polysaccharide secretion pseudopilin HpsC [Roseofilum casamattae]|uniref:Hormogonium polysaccharide secretion pseudopilin HpsC n=1 Tax=Roseofilum casamattae BLCC-M143 TaxID=3022442 RepID=A0ABT7C2T2_9CYAN|nr:hormogonium polysaccharide secretion pseudopilin HpsC [Roseofilum casamattae]MDJ1184986.1 hormogonium polysaccharide secretion pseudopilin HpsC [Roseofilum casamattae BLCC-M143]